MNFGILTELIEKSEFITIFRHEHPDCDACGSQFGLREWIRDNWPDKKVYAIGKETCSQGRFPVLDEVSDEVIASSLAIVCDTADTKRIDDQRALSASMIVKIDHHPDLDAYGNVRLVNPHAAAVCEILAGYFRSENKIVSVTTAEYLYQGILTDTLSFSTSNTTSETLEAASYLASYGVHIPEINRQLFDRSIDEFRFAGYVTSHVTMADEHTAYVKLSMRELEEWNMSAGDARTYVSELGHVRDFEIWCIFTETQPGVYAASCRSKTAAINTIAQEFGGGGHKNAAGIKGLSEESLHLLIEKLIQSRL